MALTRYSKEEDRSGRGIPSAPSANSNGSSNTAFPSSNTPLPSSSKALFRRFSGTLFAGEGQGTRASQAGGVDAADDTQADISSESAPNPLAPFSVVNLFRFVGMSRSAELCKYFDLPPTEVFLDDFNCALRKGIVLQGRMYIFDHYLCFSSFVFGFAKRVVIPLERVLSIKKKTHLRFPNSIKVEANNDQGEVESYFFTSFLSREDAFVLLSQRWVDTTPGAAHMLEGGSPRRTATSIVVDTLSPHPTFGQSLIQTPQMPITHVSPRQSAPGAMELSPHGNTRSSVPRDYDEDEENDGCCCESVWGVIIDSPVPAQAPDATVVIQAVLEGTPQQLFEVLLADNSHMLEDFLEAQGNKRINLGGWKRDADVLGHVRDISFISPIKGAYANWGKATTQCFQSHRLRQFPGQYLVFESSQTMTDIPYGDCFTVDMRWDVTPLTPTNTPTSPGDLPAPGGQTPLPRSPFNSFNRPASELMDTSPAAPQMRLDISVRVPFSRKCLWKSLIENGSKKQIKEQYLELVDQLREQLSQLGRDQQPVVVGPNAPAHSLAQRLSVALQPGQLPTVGSLSNMFNRHEGLSVSQESGHAGGQAHQVSRIGSLHGGRGALGRSTASHVIEPSKSTDTYPMKPAYQGQGQSWMQRAQEGVRWLMDVSNICGYSLTMGQVVCILVMAGMLVLQLMVLFGTMQAARSVSRHAHHLAAAGHHAGQAVSGGLEGVVGEGLAAARKDMWAQRAALLEAELELMQQHVSAVAQQLKQARALSGQ